MYFKTYYLISVPLFTNFCNISMYLSFVMHFPEDGHTCAKKCRIYTTFIMSCHNTLVLLLGIWIFPIYLFPQWNTTAHLICRQDNQILNRHFLYFFIVAIFSTQCRNNYTSALQYYIKIHINVFTARVSRITELSLHTRCIGTFTPKDVYVIVTPWNCLDRVLVLVQTGS